MFQFPTYIGRFWVFGQVWVWFLRFCLTVLGAVRLSPQDMRYPQDLGLDRTQKKPGLARFSLRPNLQVLRPFLEGPGVLGIEKK
jgi:hypothetical protein